MATPISRTRARAATLSARCQEWIDRQPSDSIAGVAVESWRRYRAIQGPLQSALLSLYILVAIVPALIVMEGYLESNPTALTNSVVHHYGLSQTTAHLVRGVFSQDENHHLGAALIAVASALFVGINYGRVLQDVHVRAWGLTLPVRRNDFPRYLATLLGLYGLILVLLLQMRQLSGDTAWARLALIPGWIALLTLYFLWVKRMLTYKLVPRRDMLPASVLTAGLIVVVMLISSWVMDLWINFYAGDYGGFGVVMALFFWIGFSSAVIIFALSLSPSLAGRRHLHHQDV